jgi:hypothetical protein
MRSMNVRDEAMPFMWDTLCRSSETIILFGICNESAMLFADDCYYTCAPYQAPRCRRVSPEVRIHRDSREPNNL